MVAQPITLPISDSDGHTASKDAVALWAIFNALEAVPATPETQLAFGEARLRLQQRIADVGIDTGDIDVALAAAGHLRLETRGDPPVSC